MTVIHKTLFVLFALLIMACGSSSPPAIHIEIVNKAPCCGAPSLENVWVNDTAFIVARPAKTVVIFLYDEVLKKHELIFSCPGSGAGCRRVFGAIFAQYKFRTEGLVYVVALGSALRSDDFSTDMVMLHHKEARRIDLLVHQ